MVATLEQLPSSLVDRVNKSTTQYKTEDVGGCAADEIDGSPSDTVVVLKTRQKASNKETVVDVQENANGETTKI